MRPALPAIVVAAAAAARSLINAILAAPSLPSLLLPVPLLQAAGRAAGGLARRLLERCWTRQKLATTNKQDGRIDDRPTQLMTPVS